MSRVSGRGVFRGILFTLLAGLLPLGGVESARRWPFTVDATGELSVVIPLVAFQRHEFIAGGLTLRHALVFDGEKYLSKIYIPEIESFVIRVKEGYRWRRGDGGGILFANCNGTLDEDGKWTLTRIGANTLVVEAVGRTDRYEYKGCVPVSAVVDGRKYKWEYGNDNLLLGIRKDGGAEDIVHVNYRDDGMISQVEAAGTTLKLKYNRERALILCEKDGATVGRIVISYFNHLLGAISTEKVAQRFEWGRPKLNGYFDPVVAQRPIVENDGKFKYDVTIGRRKVEVRFHSIDGLNGMWEYEGKTGIVRMSDIGSSVGRSR